MSFPSPIVIGSKSFERIQDGVYLDVATDVNTPSLLQLANRNLIGSNGSPVANGQPGQLTLTRLVYKDSSVPGAPDSILKCWRSYQWVSGQFTKAEIVAVDAELTTFVTASGVMDRLLRAEK